MAKNPKHGKKRAATKAKKARQQKRGKTKAKDWFMNITDWLFDSFYDVVTWVCIALSCGFLIGFYFTHRWRGFVWAAAMLLIFTIVMLAIRADRFVRAKTVVPPKSEVSSVAANLSLNGKLVANRIVEVNLEFLNGGGETAENLSGEIGFVYQNKPSKPEPGLCATGTTFGPINLLPHAQIPILIRGLTPLPAAELVAIENGTEWLFFCGSGSYDGISGRVPMKFCWVYRREVQEFTDCTDLPNVANTADVAPVNRPWLSVVDVVPAGPLVFREGGVDLPVSIVIQNTGQSPANKVVLKAAMFFPALEDLNNPIIKQQKEVCERKSYAPGVTIFHSEPPKAFPWHFVLDRQEMESQWAVIKERVPITKLNTNVVSPVLVGCVDYLVGETHHQTGFVYRIMTFDPARDPDPVAIPIGENIPTNQIVIQKFTFLGGDYAN